jgi:hypothetical protein
MLPLFFIAAIRVEDQVDAGARRIQCRLAPDRVRHRLFAHAVRLAHHRVAFFLGKGGDQLAVRAALDPVHRDLDAVDAVLDLAADLLDRLVEAGDELADRGFGRADPGRVPIGQTLMRRDVRPGRHDPRPVKQTGIDRVADRQADLPRIARRADRRVARRHNLLRKEHAAQRAELERAIEIDVFLGLGVAIGEVRVDIDEARHHELAGVVDHPVALAAPGRPGRLADIGQLARVVIDERAVFERLVVLPGEQLTALDKSLHRTGLLWNRSPPIGGEGARG